MQKMLWGVGLCVLACAPCARGISNHDAENALRDSLANQQLLLRNFSGEEKVHAAWNGSDVALDAPRWRTIAQVEIDSVKMKGHRLTMSGSRRVLVKDGDGNISVYPTPSKMEIDVDLGDADPIVGLPRLKDALFYGSLDEALAALPKEMRDRVPARVNMSSFEPVHSVDPSAPTCDCAAKDMTECPAKGVEAKGVSRPVVLKQTNPELTQEARQAGRLDAHVNISFIVNRAGQPRDLWIMKPAGLGLDEEAAESVLKYVFHPATCRNKPVAVYLNVDVRFQRY